MRLVQRIAGQVTLAAAALAASLASPAALAALTIAPISTTVGIENVLTSALLAPSSGINLGAVTYQGVNNTGVQQSGTYTGFNLAPSSGTSPTLTMGDGIFLTSGNANIPLTNTLNNFRGRPGSGGNTQLTTLSNRSTFDANALSFDFSVGAGITSVSAQFVFGTDEFPTQQVTDIFGFFVDGVNYARFSSGELISNTPGNPTNFISNPVGGGLYGIEYNGLTRVFNVVGLLGAGNAGVHKLTIAIADTSDDIFDSGVFISSLKAGTSTGGGINPNPNPVPEPASLALVALALAGAAAVRRRQKPV